METDRGAWRAVGWSMAAGSAYDLLFALAILLAQRLTARLLGLEVPSDPVYLNLVGVLLLLLAAIYAVAARDAERYQGVVIAAAGGRLLGAVFLVSAWLAGRPAAFLGLAIGDLALGLLHGLLFARARSGAAVRPPP